MIPEFFGEERGFEIQMTSSLIHEAVKKLCGRHAGTQ
jgi:hypothetical protein